MLTLSRVPLSQVFSSVRTDRYALVKGDNTNDHGASRRRRVATKLSDTGRICAHNDSLVPLLTLRHCQGDKSSPYSHPFFHGPLSCNTLQSPLHTHARPFDLYTKFNAKWWATCTAACELWRPHAACWLVTFSFFLSDRSYYSWKYIHTVQIVSNTGWLWGEPQYCLATFFLFLSSTSKILVSFLRVSLLPWVQECV